MNIQSALNAKDLVIQKTIEANRQLLDTLQKLSTNLLNHDHSCHQRCLHKVFKVQLMQAYLRQSQVCQDLKEQRCYWDRMVEHLQDMEEKAMELAIEDWVLVEGQ